MPWSSPTSTPMLQHVAFLEQFHDLDGKLGVVATIETLQVPGHVPGASLLALSSQHVRDQL